MAYPRLSDAINCRIVSVEQETDEAGRLWTTFAAVDATDHLTMIRMMGEPGHLLVTKTMISYAPIAADDFDDVAVEPEEETLEDVINGALSPKERHARMEALRRGSSVRGELDEGADFGFQ